MNYRILEKENSWFVPQYKSWGVWWAWKDYSYEYITPDIKFATMEKALEFISRQIALDTWKDRVVYEVKI